MPTRITHFLHDSVITGAQSLGTAFNTSDVHVHDLQLELPRNQREARNYRGIIGGLFVQLTNGSSPSATKCTIRICADAAGDTVLVPDTEASLVAGITTTTTQCCAYSIDLPIFQILAGPGNGSLYVFAKVDDATVAPVMAQTCITWQE